MPIYYPNPAPSAIIPPDIDAPLPLTGPYYYLPTNWDAAWKAAKAAIGGRQISVVGIGDSITQGWGSTDFMIDAWWAKLRSAILSANNNSLAGDCYGLTYSSAYETALGGPSTTSYPLTLAEVNDNNGGYNFFTVNSGAFTPYVTCTPPYNVVGFDIIYLDFLSVSPAFSYKVDSGSTINIDTVSPAAFPSAIVKKISIIGLTPGIHTLTINCSSTSAACNILAINAYASTSVGLLFANMGWPGMGLVTGLAAGNNLSDQGTAPVDRLAIYQGFTGTTASPTALSGFGFPSQPDLAIIAFGVNDAAGGVSRANFRDALDRLVWSLRYGKNDACSIIIVAMWGPDGTIASSSSVSNTDYTGSQTTPYRDMRAAMLEVAQDEQCAFVDVHGAFGRTPITNGWITSTSNIHPTTAGHLKIANLLSAIV